MSPFPAGPPSSPEDPVAIRDNDWRTFQALSGMEDHWQRPGWTPGRRSWHWMLAADDDPVRQLARQCQDVLDASPIGDRLDPVPLDALHVTLGRIGFTDEIDQATALAVAAEAAPACADLLAFPVEVGPLAGSRGALRFSLTPWTSLLVLHERLARATRRVLGARCVMDTDVFRPHLSIAYAHDTIPMQELLPTLRRLRARHGEIQPLLMTVEDVVLVELRRVERSYRYDVLVRVPLPGGQRPAASAVIGTVGRRCDV